MASFERLYSQAAATRQATKRTPISKPRRMAEMAEFITRRWPGTDDADAAQSVLVSFAIRNNRIEDAEKLLADASDESRPRLELQLGNAMWARYLELSQAEPGNGARCRRRWRKLKESAVKYLRSGFDAAREGASPSESAAAAGLYLAQALLSDEKYDEAIELLEDENRAADAHRATSIRPRRGPQYVVEAYKAALAGVRAVDAAAGEESASRS